MLGEGGLDLENRRGVRTDYFNRLNKVQRKF